MEPKQKQYLVVDVTGDRSKLTATTKLKSAVDRVMSALRCVCFPKKALSGKAGGGVGRARKKGDVMLTRSSFFVRSSSNVIF